MDPSTIASVGAGWLWERFSDGVIEKAYGEVKGRWRQFHWKKAEREYQSKLKDILGTTRLLGNPKPISIEGIFTDVHVLDKMTAFRRFDLQELRFGKKWKHGDRLSSAEKKRRQQAKRRTSKKKDLSLNETQRSSALEIIEGSDRLYILGKPGAGKTTLLKFLALQACQGKISKIPIFVPMKSWADSGKDILDFIEGQFEVCQFPDAGEFIRRLLRSGEALVLFDGLDEVNREGNKRQTVITKMNQFADQYSEAQICLTCRIAATDYSFARFTYVEIADFDDRQIEFFSKKWFQPDRERFQHFWVEFNRGDNEGLRDLARTPLLLALLCLAFDETLTFPERKVDLYRDAIDALLKKWDSSRGIARDETYRRLSPLRKEQMLARIAAENFSNADYFVRQERLSEQIYDYLRMLPGIHSQDLPDGETTLNAIEAQHGLLVQRAHRIYSFSHLTFQEYFTARYIVENSLKGTISRLLKPERVTDDRWYEVILSVASLLDDWDAFLRIFHNELVRYLRGEEAVYGYLHSVSGASLASPRPLEARLVLLALSATEGDKPVYSGGPIRDLYILAGFSASKARWFRQRLQDPSKALKSVGISSDGLPVPSELSKSEFQFLEIFLRSQVVFSRALNLGTVSDRDYFWNLVLTVEPVEMKGQQ